MTDVDLAAPEVAETVSAPEAESPKAETVAAEEVEKQAERTFTQAELDKAVQERLAKEQRKFERERRQELERENERLRAAQSQPKPVEAPGRPDRKDFADDGDWIEAVSDWKASQKISQELSAHQQRLQQSTQQQEFTKAVQTHAQREQAFRAANPSYDDVVTDDLPISRPMAETILLSEKGPEIAMYLGNNPEEAARIFNLPAPLAAKEIGKIEGKLEAPAPKISKAPAPMKPVHTAQALSKDLEKMSQEEFESHMRKSGSRFVR